MFSTNIRIKWNTESKITFHESHSENNDEINHGNKIHFTYNNSPLSVEILTYIQHCLCSWFFHALLLLLLLLLLCFFPPYPNIQPTQSNMKNECTTTFSAQNGNKIKTKQKKNWRLWKCYKKSLKSRGRYFNSLIHSVLLMFYYCFFAVQVQNFIIKIVPSFTWKS